MTEHSYLSRLDYLEGHGTEEQRRAFEREVMVLNVHQINRALKRNAPHGRAYYRIRAVNRALAYTVIAVVVLAVARALLILWWAAFGS